MTAYTRLRAVNSTFAALAERDFKHRHHALLHDASLEFYSHWPERCKCPLVLSFNRFSRDGTRAHFLLEKDTHPVTENNRDAQKHDKKHLAAVDKTWGEVGVGG